MPEPERKALDEAAAGSVLLIFVVLVADVVEGTSIVLAVVSIKTELPADWRAVGASPSGVRVVEPVTFRFDEGYPVYPPDITSVIGPRLLPTSWSNSGCANGSGSSP